jgi:hypothetical protein
VTVSHSCPHIPVILSEVRRASNGVEEPHAGWHLHRTPKELSLHGFPTEGLLVTHFVLPLDIAIPFPIS